MRRAGRALPTLLLAAVALAGCAGSGGDAASPREEAGDGRPGLRAAVTDGRTGDAVTGRDAGPLRSLSGGGRADASEPRRERAERDGVGAGEACTDPELMPAAGSLATIEATTLCLLNGLRADGGLPPLSTNARLARAASAHSADMVANSYFAHEGLDGSDIRDRIGATGYLPASGRWVIGENLAWGTGALATPKAIVNAWMNSAGHRANILRAEYREVGLGIVIGNPTRSDGSGATYATEFGHSGATRSTPRRAPAASRRAAAERRAGARAKQATRSRRARQAKVRAERAQAARLRAPA